MRWTPRRAVPAAIAAAFVAGAVAVVLVVGHSSPVRGARVDVPLEVRASFDAPVVQFGDRVVARVVVLADRTAVDTRSLRIVQSVAPLAQLGPARSTRTTRGRLLVVTVSVSAVCIDETCLAGQGLGPRLVRLPAVRVTAPRTGGGDARAKAAWPALEIRGRAVAADLAAASPHLRGSVTPPPVSYRIAPGTLARLLDVVAALLVAAGAALLAWQVAAHLRRRRRPEAASELARALALLREAETRSPDDRRRAVELVARLLRRRDEALALAAGDIAWSEPKPTPAALADLADRVVREVDGA